MNEQLLMSETFRLARRGAGRVSPNPLVGALLYKNGIVAGSYHPAYGEFHAERRVLLSVPYRKSKGAVLFVNLEPCDHYGKTPPCTEIIKKSGVREVVIGMTDPNPVVRGKGIRRLRNCGIKVKLGVAEKEARFLNRGYIYHFEKKRPWFILKAASSLDGRIASAFGESRWISGEESRAFGHRLRYESDGVLAGRKTVLSDDPRLIPYKIKKSPHPLRRPIRIILDSNLKAGPGAGVFDTSSYDTIVFHSSLRLREKKVPGKTGARLIKVSRSGRGLNLKMIARALYEENIQTVLVEGGGEIFTSFYREGLVDEAYYFYHPFILGGDRAALLCSGPGFRLRRAYPFRTWNLKKMGEDFLFHGVCSRV
ncbi:MAG TPA: bifunctional diaminohydroxyphosphoribosylaminopyrimidine deaminase/5-amino-6-(5-phosphoribosylamino)uracil reductase RibD [bacterium]|nr:bifunctional diaminohydroxyphosphoribosylaminopyrimidine deaminase/5-amino-6-(5-phosphoribosylamino)uracil reductase RibD [bacterium]